MGSASGAGYFPRLMLSASLPEIALRRHPTPGAFRRRGCPGLGSAEHDGLVAVQHDAVFGVPFDGAGEHDVLDVTA